MFRHWSCVVRTVIGLSLASNPCYQYCSPHNVSAHSIIPHKKATQPHSQTHSLTKCLGTSQHWMKRIFHLSFRSQYFINSLKIKNSLYKGNDTTLTPPPITIDTYFWTALIQISVHHKFESVAVSTEPQQPHLQILIDFDTDQWGKILIWNTLYG